MNANATNTEEKYAWVDAILENCALQERRDYEDQALEEETNPEWNQDEDGAEDWDDYMEHCEHCNAVFDTDRQLGYHQMVCMPGNNDLCADFLARPPPLTRQNCCPLTRVEDADDCMEVDELEEELIADRSMEDDEELEDLVLYNIKRYQELTFAPFKRQKTYHEHPIPEPMDICDSEDEADAVEAHAVEADAVEADTVEDEDYMSEHDELEPRELFPDDDEEDDLLSVMSDIEVEPVGSDDEYNYDNDVEDPHADIIFPEFDNDGNILPIPMDIVEDEEEQASNLGPAPSFQRANTFWVDEESGQIVYNGNPNGSRFFEDEDEDDIVT